ncbi:MAG: hypothetical protein Q8N81_07745 [bacterium]|nr:hypothetical protein [bacterium]
MKKSKRVKNTTIDDLAILVAKGFESTATKDDIARLDRRMDTLEHGQEDIKLKLDNVAYRFELVELQRRVALLEKRNGLRR